jgi:hypothetical protein
MVGMAPEIRVVHLMDQETANQLLENRKSYWEKENYWREWIKEVPAQIEALNLRKQEGQP